MQAGSGLPSSAVPISPVLNSQPRELARDRAKYCLSSSGSTCAPAISKASLRPKGASLLPDAEELGNMDHGRTEVRNSSDKKNKNEDGKEHG